MLFHTMDGNNNGVCKESVAIDLITLVRTEFSEIVRPLYLTCLPYKTYVPVNTHCRLPNTRPFSVIYTFLGKPYMLLLWQPINNSAAILSSKTTNKKINWHYRVT